VELADFPASVLESVFKTDPEVVESDNPLLEDESDVSGIDIVGVAERALLLIVKEGRLVGTEELDLDKLEDPDTGSISGDTVLGD